MNTQEVWRDSQRLAGLRRFAVAITVLNVLGHLYFGFEQSYAQPLCALLTAYTTELLLEIIDARANSRTPRFLGTTQSFVDFLLSAHITGLAVAMLLYSNARLWPTIFAAAAAISSKSVFRISVGNATRHVFNPSNFGIALTLLLFPWVGIAPPYHFSENLPPVGRWLLPVIIVCSGTFLNARFTKRLPLIAAWLGGFGLQAALRSWTLHTPLIAALLPTTGVAFILFTFYMVTDPGTTPSRPREQIVFGGVVSATYGVLLALHIVFGLVFSLAAVCAGRFIISHAFAERHLEVQALRRALSPQTARASTSPASPILKKLQA